MPLGTAAVTACALG